MSDELGAAGIRERVLAAWRAAPDRFREDANAEEDLALGGYRDRAVVELAQNAADAAVRAGVPGRLLLRLAETDDGLVLVAANTGATLDAEGVRALASLRASAKRDEQGVGRFGVGFAAVLALSDSPAVVSHGRGVRFSRADSADLVAGAARDVPALALELERRDGHVPALRLPFEAEGVAPVGYDTAVLLPLRDRSPDGGASHELVLRLLDDAGDPLLLALPGLAEVVVEVPGQPPRRVHDVASRWHTRTVTGRHAAGELADRPTEERHRPGWTVTWAVPRADPEVPRVVHAPTPTDEPLDWPALLIASFPLEPTRRHVADGAARDALVAHAALAYADLLTTLATGGVDALALVPTGLPAGSLDADLREQTLPLLAVAPVLRGVEGDVVRPRDAVTLATSGDDARVLATLAPLIAGLVAAPRSAAAALTALGVRPTEVADVVEALPSHPEPAWWGRLYVGLVPLADDAVGREALAWMPVPLADGRVVRGVRGLLLPGAELEGAHLLGGLASHGLRVVHPEALTDDVAAGLLERLGAVPAGARAVLGDAAVQAAVDDVVEQVEDGAGLDEVAGIVDAVIALVAAAVRSGDLRAGDLAWLGDLPLPDADGEPAPAAGLVLPGSAAERLLDSREVGVLAAEVADRWPDDALEAVGVARSLSLLRWRSLDTREPPDELLDLDGGQEWVAGLEAGTAADVVAVRDLDLVGDDRWAEALAVIAGEPQLLAALRDAVRVVTPDGVVALAPAYTAWWLRRRLGLAGCADPDAEPGLATALRTPPGWVADLAPATRAALALPRAWSDLDADGWTAALAAARDTGPASLLAMWHALARAADAGDLADVTPPDRLATLRRGGVEVVDAADAVVVDAPMWLQRDDLGGQLVVPGDLAEALADVLDVDLASEVARGSVEPGGEAVDVPDVVRTLVGSVPARWFSREVLRVDGLEVGWWVLGDGAGAQVHATSLRGLARGLAQAAGAWARRDAIETLLASPGAVTQVLAEAALEEPVSRGR